MKINQEGFYVFFMMFVIIIFQMFVSRPLPEVSNDKPVFHEWYSLTRYNIAGSDRYQYVIDFVFESEIDAFSFIQKFEELRIVKGRY